MKFLDRFFERSARHVAYSTSRRNALVRFGSWVVVGSALPLILPVDRSSGNAHAAEPGTPGDPGDPQSCDYWRYCSIDGFLDCIGGNFGHQMGFPGNASNRENDAQGIQSKRFGSGTLGNDHSSRS